MTRILHPAPPQLIRNADLADEALNRPLNDAERAYLRDYMAPVHAEVERNREPDGLLGRIGPAEVMLGLAVAFAIGFALAVMA